MACPAALKMKLTIEPMMPGRALAACLPAIAKSLGGCFQAIQGGKHHGGGGYASSQDNHLQGPAVFLEDFLNPLEQGPLPFPQPQSLC